MKKKISCRVINSVHIAASDIALQPIYAKCLYETDELNTAKFWFEQTKSSGKIKALKFDMGIINSMPSGKILDYLA